MCLLKKDDPDSVCNHDECKNHYALNKHFCSIGIPNNQSPANQHLLLAAQGQKPTILQHPTLQPINNINVKRSLPKDPEPIGYIQKKVRTDEPLKDGELSQSFQELNKQLENYQYGGQTGYSQNQSQDRGVFSNPMLNNLLVSAPQQPTQGYNAPAIIIPYIQNGQNPMQQPISLMQQPQNPNMAGNISGAALNNQFVQLVNQSQQKPKFQGTSMLSGPSTQAETKKGDSNPASEAFMKEFQTRILGLLFTQNKMLVDLKEKNEVLQDTLACLITEINSLKAAIKVNHIDKPAIFHSNPLITHQIIGNSTESVTTEHLISYLFGANTDFQYQLVLKSELPLPLYRERNFRFTVILTDKKGNPIENPNRIPLTIGIYSSENPPKYIDCNTAGNKILKGFIEKDLVNGSASFEKIQIKEVSSHFRNGWIFFVVYPKLSTTTNNLMGNSGSFIHAQKIKPLILEKVIVKAKKAKGKDAGNDDENMVDERDENDEKEELEREAKGDGQESGSKGDSVPKEEVVYV